MYKCRHFKIYELVDPGTYRKYGQMCWKFFDERVLEAADICRDLFGPLTINSWKWGGRFKWSGLRTTRCRIGSKLSAHRRGCGLDPKSKKYSGAQMRAAIRRGYLERTRNGCLRRTPGLISIIMEEHKFKRLKELINEIELGTTTWMHIARTNRVKFAWIPKPKKKGN